MGGKPNPIPEYLLTPWEDIAEELELTVPEVRRIYRNAVRKIRRLPAKQVNEIKQILREAERSRDKITTTQEDNERLFLFIYLGN